MIRLYIQAIVRFCVLSVVSAIGGFTVLASVFILGTVLGHLAP